MFTAGASALGKMLGHKRAVEIVKRRNDFQILHAKRSLEILERRDEHLEGLLARHELIEERNKPWEEKAKPSEEKTKHWEMHLESENEQSNLGCGCNTL